MAKRQTEIPGAERPSIAELDAEVIKMIKAHGEKNEANDRYKACREKAHALFVTAKEKGQIEGETYRYGDGEATWDIRLNRPDELLTFKRVDDE